MKTPRICFNACARHVQYAADQFPPQGEIDKHHVPQQTGVSQGSYCKCIAQSMPSVQLNLLSGH